MTAIVNKDPELALKQEAIGSSETPTTVRIEPIDGSWDEFDRITNDERAGKPEGDVIVRKHRGDPL
jgi:hypothetical protein